MKILFVNERYGYAGGIEQNVVDTSDGLRARGHACYLAYGTKTQRGDVEGYKDHFDGCFAASDLGPDSTADSLEYIIETVAPDVVYLHKFNALKPFASCLRKTHTVRVIHDHDLCCPTGLKYYRVSGRICPHKAGGWRCWTDGGFLARSLKSPTGFTFSGIGGKMREMRRNFHLDVLAVDSHFMREELLQNGFPEEKIHVVPHIVRLPECTPAPVLEAPNILYVGQLIRGKGVDLLLQVLAQVDCDFQARIVGTGNAQPKLEALAAELDLLDRVRFEGWVAHEALEEHYAWAKLLVTPSRWAEPYGMVGLEAMNHGRATVAFAVGGIPDWCRDGENGLLAPPQDTQAFAHAVTRVLTEAGLAERMGAAARARILEEFGFDDYLDAVESLLEKACATA